MDGKRITISPPPPPFPLLYFSLPTILSFTQVTVIWKQCTPKAGVGAVYTFTFRYWSPCEKFPGEHHVKLWDGTKLLRFAESASSNIVSYSGFIWLNGSITLIRAGTERCDIVRFSKVTTKYLASGTGSYESNELCEVCVSIQIHQSAYRDQTNIPVRGRVVVLNCQRSWYADWWIWIDAHTSNAFGWDFCTGHVEKAGLATSGSLFSRNFGRIELSFGWGMDIYLMDREPVFSR